MLNLRSSKHFTDSEPPLSRVFAEAGKLILGKDDIIRLAVACLLARGHLLIEDLPGVGKTTLAHVLAQVLGLQFQRVQFTSDMLPADVIGVTIFERDTSTFRFHQGPVFSQVVLADEINRATPRTQSALLEAMEERQITVEGETHRLPQPFFVIATQNPVYQLGTFPLPESQLDRFLMRIELGYPEPQAERLLLQGEDRRSMLGRLAPVLDASALLELQQTVTMIHAASALLDYLQDILAYTRNRGRFAVGLSPRAGLSLLHAAQAWAFLQGRNQVIPEDVQAVLPAVAGHRLQPAEGHQGDASKSLIMQMLRDIPVP